MSVAHSPTPWPWSALPVPAQTPLFSGARTSHATRARFPWHACQNVENAWKYAWHARNPLASNAHAKTACICVHAGSKERPHERKQHRCKQMLARGHAPSRKKRLRMHACDTNAPQARCLSEQMPPHARSRGFCGSESKRLDVGARGGRGGRQLPVLRLCIIGESFPPPRHATYSWER